MPSRKTTDPSKRTEPSKPSATAPTDVKPGAAAPAGERIAKVIAAAGVCSRRDAERKIAAGAVTVNGRRIVSPALNVSTTDRVTVDGEDLPDREPPRLWRYHKPRGLVTTHADPEGRKTVFEALPAGLPRVVSIGRLDLNTEGLLLLTNSGALARHLELPTTGWARRYRVRGHGRVSADALAALKDGITIDGVRYAGIDARIDREQGANLWLTLALREGKNREIRVVLGHLGLEVNRLIRVSYGPLMLGELGVGSVDEVKTRVLIDQLGRETAAALGIVPQGRGAGAGTSAKSQAHPPAKGRATSAKDQATARKGDAAAQARTPRPAAPSRQAASQKITTSRPASGPRANNTPKRGAAATGSPANGKGAGRPGGAGAKPAARKPRGPRPPR